MTRSASIAPRALAALAIAALAAGACQRGWSEQDRRAFLNDCLTNARIDDEALRERICTCWLDRSAATYRLAEINGNDAQVQAGFLEIGQVCSSEYGVRAQLPEAIGAPPGAPAAPGP